MRETLKNLLILTRKKIIPNRALALFIHYLSCQEEPGDMRRAEKILKYNYAEIMCLTSVLKMIKVVRLLDNPDGIIIQVVPSLTDQRLARILRNSGLQNKIEQHAVRIRNRSHSAKIKYGGAIETIAYLLPKEYATFYLDPVKLRVLDRLSETIDIEDYTKWFILNKLVKLNQFNLSIFTHGEILSEYRKYHKGQSNGD